MWFSALLWVLLMGESLLPAFEEVQLTGLYVRTYTGILWSQLGSNSQGAGHCEIRETHVSMCSCSVTEVCFLSSLHLGLWLFFFF